VIDLSPGDEVIYRKAARALSGQRTGEVVRVTNHFVFVWNGGKRPAQIPRDRIVSVRVKETADE
jgi:hypothetical protein